jgi:hypothetical protein
MPPVRWTPGPDLQPRHRMKIWSGIFVGLLSFICFAQQSFAGSAFPLKLEWQPSDDASVTGYALYYGVDGAPMTNRMDVGLSTSVILNNLTPSKDYSFYVVAYDSEQDESAPSNFLDYTARVISDLKLSPSTEGTVTVSFKVAPNAACHVEYTDTLNPPNWQLLTTATGNSDGAVTVPDTTPAPGGCRFYRAAVDFPGPIIP